MISMAPDPGQKGYFCYNDRLLMWLEYALR